MGDNQLGVFDSSNVARDLLGVPMFSTNTSYVAGAAVNYQGILYIASTAISAAAFNPAQWFQPRAGASSTHNGLLSFVSTTALQFVPYYGNQIKINGTIYSIPTAGIVGLGNTNVFVNGVAAQSLVANTTYWVFAFSNAGVVTADFRTAATHAPSATAGNEGIEILTGDNTRSLIGMIQTGAAGVFQDSLRTRGVLSWFNRSPKLAQSNLTADRSTTSNTFVKINAEIDTSFLCWASDHVSYGASGSCQASAVTNINTTMYMDGVILQTANQASSDNVANGDMPFSVFGGSVLTEGWHTASLYGFITATGTAFWFGTIASGAGRVTLSVMTRG
jgi:hypothetical protein